MLKKDSFLFILLCVNKIISLKKLVINHSALLKKVRVTYLETTLKNKNCLALYDSCF